MHPCCTQELHALMPPWPVARRSYMHCLQQMLWKEGALSFYRGFLVNCGKTLPGAAIQFIAYDLIKCGIAVVDPTAGVTSPL